MLLFRFYCLRELDMDNKDEVLLTSLFLVSQYLSNTNRVPNAIEMCKDFLFLLENKTPGNTDQTWVKRFENVHSHPIKRGTKRLLTFRQVFARKVELSTTCTLAELYESQREYSEAEGLYLKALNIAEKIGDRKIEAKCYGKLGRIFKSLGEYVRAKEHYEKALAIAVKIGDRITELKCSRNLAMMFYDLGEYVKLGEHCEKVLSIVEKVGDIEPKARSYRGLGSLFTSLGEYVKAKEYCEKAIAIAEKIGHRETETKCYGNLGMVFSSLGEYVRAKEHHEKAIAIAEKIGDRKTEAKCYTDLGIIFNFLGEYVKVKEHCEKALAIAEKIGDRKTKAWIYGNLGRIFTELGEYVRAKEHYEKVLASAEKIGDRETEAVSYRNRGKINCFLDEHAKAKECIEKALVLEGKYGNSEDESFSHLILSALMFEEGNISEGKSNAFASFVNMEVIRRLQVHDKFKISYFDGIFKNYRMLSQLLCDAGFAYEALYTEEFRRARALTDLMAARYSVENEIPVSPPTWDYIESIVKKECNCACLYISYGGQLINFGVVKADNPLTFQQIKVNDVFGSAIEVADLLIRGIYRKVLCLAPEQCENRSWLPSNAYWEQGCERPILEEDEVENQPPVCTPACVYKMIIAPVVDYLDEPEIIIVPDRNLYKVPFAALENESGKCLSECYRIRIAPSLTTLKLIQDCPADYHYFLNCVPKITYLCSKLGNNETHTRK